MKIKLQIVSTLNNNRTGCYWIQYSLADSFNFLTASITETNRVVLVSLPHLTNQGCFNSQSVGGRSLGFFFVQYDKKLIQSWDHKPFELFTFGHPNQINKLSKNRFLQIIYIFSNEFNYLS